jgi:orotate phosphoribosyltransferase
MSPEEVLELFRGTGALLEGHFELSSGRHADRYFQCALLLAQPPLAERLARAVATSLRSEGSMGGELPDLVLGPALGAVVWAQEVARALGTPAYFTERVGGVMTLRRGFRLAAGQRVLVVEDVLTTGGSVREVLACVATGQARVVGVASIVNRSGSDDPFRSEGLPFTALANLEAKSWTPEECPLCAAGSQAVKPGSRPGAPTRAARS